MIFLSSGGTVYGVQEQQPICENALPIPINHYGSVKLCIEMFNTTLWENGDEVLVHILDSAMTLAIGVEFIKMLCKHTPATVIEVLLFAIARQLVVMHTTPLENLITVVSIAILFAVRKYFFRTEDKTGGFFKHKKENSETEGK